MDIVCSHFMEEGEAQGGGITCQSHTAIALGFLISSLMHLTNHHITCSFPSVITSHHLIAKIITITQQELLVQALKVPKKQLSPFRGEKPEAQRERVSLCAKVTGRK